MKKTITLVLFLGIVAAISGLGISFVNDITRPIIEEKAIESEKVNLEMMFPGADFLSVDYKGDDERVLGVYEVSGTGYIVKAEGRGYSSTPIIALVGFDMEGEILDVVILQEQETKGYGTRCFEDAFIDSAYVGKDLEEEVDLLSGATKTSIAMQNLIASARNAFAEVAK